MQKGVEQNLTGFDKPENQELLKRKTSAIIAEVAWIIAEVAWIIADVVTHFDTLRRSIGRATRSLTASVSITCAVD